MEFVINVLEAIASTQLLILVMSMSPAIAILPVLSALKDIHCLVEPALNVLLDPTVLPAAHQILLNVSSVTLVSILTDPMFVKDVPPTVLLVILPLSALLLQLDIMS
eukprot:TRINITY_DN1922_c0_g1_i1.p2 TRINITY_DN1922_c0_g1~~TRINITY_DN1922_c0_g1_i1.p2  ORF type:complete len:107 (+),score=10.77 TRINITY_DN1922_c0_g1_i1:2166-2486(+)